MQYKPANWVTGFKRSPRAANVQHRDMGLFLNSSGKFEPIDDSWDNLHSGGLFISDDNKLYFRDETNKDIYINSPAAETLGLSAGNATTAGFVTINEEGFDTDFRVEASGVANALFVRGSDGNVGIGTDSAINKLLVAGIIHSYEAGGGNHRILASTGAGATNVVLDTDGDSWLVGGNMGIGTTGPGTLLELFGTAPYLTLRNSTHEDGDGGRESKIIFEGEQSGGEDSTLAVIQASHDGTSDDEKGDLIFSTNDGNDAAAPTERMRIDSAGKVGVGTDAPEATLHVASDSGTYPTIAGDLLVSNNSAADDTAAISIICGTAGTGYLQFGDSGDENRGFIAYDQGNDIMSFRTSGSGTDWQITAAGNLKPGAGLGIDFSANSHATGMTSELLDWYEEGTWTGVISDGTNNATMNGAATTGAYTRVGNLITVTGYFLATSLGSVSGAIRLSGLPFTCSNNNKNYASISVGFGEGMAITAGYTVAGYIPANTSHLRFELWDATTGSTTMQHSEWTADGGCVVCATYMT